MKKVLALFVAQLATQLAWAAPPGSIIVDQSALFSRGAYTCALVGAKYLAGRQIGEEHFLAFRIERAQLKKKAVQLSGAKKAKLQKKVDTLSIKSKKGDAACKVGPPNEDPGSSPTPISTPDPSQNNFDSNGNVTAIGKIRFEIPAELSASISQGSAIHNSYCVGCHSAKLSRKFNYLRSAISASPMLFSEQEISDQALANITAYLNRFNMN